MKQYTVENAYTDNYEVTQYENGTAVVSGIVAYYELEGYCDAIENNGYKRAFDVPKYECDMMAAKVQYDFAVKMYKRAKEHPLQKCNEEV